MALPSDINHREYAKFRERSDGTTVTAVLIDDKLPTEGNNASYVISYNAASYCVKIVATINSIDYTTNIVPQDGDTVITTTKTISAWT